MTKKIVLIFIVFITAILFWVAVEPWIYSPTKFSNPTIWVLPMLSIITLSSFVCVGLIVFSKQWLRRFIFIAVSLPAFFVFGFTAFLVGIIAINFVFFLLAIKKIDNEISQRLKVSPSNIARKGLPMIMMPLLISISFAYYLSPTVQNSVISKELPTSVDKVISRTISGVFDSEIQGFPTEQREKVKIETVRKVNDLLKDYLGPYFIFMPPLLAFGLFIVLQGLSYFFIWLSVILSVLIFKFMKKIGFFSIEEREVKMEFLNV